MSESEDRGKKILNATASETSTASVAITLLQISLSAMRLDKTEPIIHQSRIKEKGPQGPTTLC